MKRQMILGTILGCVGVILFTAAPVAAQGAPCADCASGSHWVDQCSPGEDRIANQGAVVGIDLNLDCVADVSLILGPCEAPDNLLVIKRDPVLDDSANFPGLRANDGHFDVIDTEIVSLCLMHESGVILKAGAGRGQNGVLARSAGAIAEQPGDDTKAYSFFDVMFEVDMGGGSLAYNHTAVRTEVGPDGSSNGITCVPPQGNYIKLTRCTPLFDDPDPGEGVHIANLVSARHNVNPPPPTTPTISEWGLIVLVVLLLTGISIVFGRHRRAAGV